MACWMYFWDASGDMEVVAVGMVVMAVGRTELGVPVLMDREVVMMVADGEASSVAGRLVVECFELLMSADLVELSELPELSELMDFNPLVDVLELRNSESDVDETELNEVGEKVLLRDVLVMLTVPVINVLLELLEVLRDVLVMLAVPVVNVLLELLEVLEEAKLKVVVEGELIGLVEKLLSVVEESTRPVTVLLTEREDELPDTEVALDVVVVNETRLVVCDDDSEDARLVADARLDVGGVTAVEDELTSLLCDEVATVPVEGTKVIVSFPSVENCWAPCREVVVEA